MPLPLIPVDALSMGVIAIFACQIAKESKSILNNKLSILKILTINIYL